MTKTSELLVVEIDGEPLQQDRNDAFIQSGKHQVDEKNEQAEKLTGARKDNLILK